MGKVGFFFLFGEAISLSGLGIFFCRDGRGCGFS